MQISKLEPSPRIETHTWDSWSALSWGQKEGWFSPWFSELGDAFCRATLTSKRKNFKTIVQPKWKWELPNILEEKKSHMQLHRLWVISDMFGFDPLPSLKINVHWDRINTMVGEPYSVLSLPCSKVFELFWTSLGICKTSCSDSVRGSWASFF